MDSKGFRRHALCIGTTHPKIEHDLNPMPYSDSDSHPQRPQPIAATFGALGRIRFDNYGS
jgi:hypothetical protein